MTDRRTEGPTCARCHHSEATCARTGKCCPTCTHFRHLDAAGNDIIKPAKVIRLDRPVCPTCSRRVSPRGRFDCPGLCRDVSRAYDASRARRRYHEQAS